MWSLVGSLFVGDTEEWGHGEELGVPGSPARGRVPSNCSRWEEADLWVTLSLEKRNGGREASENYLPGPAAMGVTEDSWWEVLFCG